MIRFIGIPLRLSSPLALASLAVRVDSHGMLSGLGSSAV
jgi:hypothetical protein